MTRRFWPAVLAAVSIVILGSYLIYTQYLVRRMRDEAAVQAKIYSLVQRGLLAPPGEELTVLLDMQKEMADLGVYLVALDASGTPTAAHVPFEADLTTESGRRRVLEYAAELRARNPVNFTAIPGFMEVYFSDPPVLKWLRWIPYLQVGAGVLLMVVAFFIMRADMRAHREQLWSAMARELAHQMGTPLSSLSGWVEVLQLTADEREGMPDTPRIGTLMQADVERLERVSRRFELIGKPPALEPVALQTVIDELVAYFAPRLPHLARGIRMRAHVERGLPLIEANQVLLVWALENVVKNAIDALAGRGGRISILALRGDHPSTNGRDPGMVHVVIADTGPGIALHVKDRIFDPGVTTKTAGWGVGLSLSRRIIEELHHGRIAVDNRARGGAVFDVTLPMAKT